MPRRRTSSPPSPRSSIELGPSRLLAVALLMLGGLAAFSVATSAAPWRLAVPLGAAAGAMALAAARRELRRPRVRLAFLGDGHVLCDGRLLDEARLAWQGPIAVLDARDGGRAIRFHGWPDVLDAAVRRELRLWAAETRNARRPPSVAP